MTDITKVKEGLNARAQSVAEKLLPNGRKEGQEWRAGSLDGEKGKSLGVHLVGAKAGVWCDFSTGETGDLIDLWAQTQRLSLSEALNEARDWLGIVRPKPIQEPVKNWAKPPKPQCRTPQSRVKDYLTEERNVPFDVIERYKVGEQGDSIVFPFLLPDGALPLVKTRKAEAGAKPKPTAANCEPVLFGWQVVRPDTREVLLCEGEIDALSWGAYGVDALSLPFGAGKGGKHNWIESEFERLERFEKIYLAMDMDKQGDIAAVDIASRLGRNRCFRVKTPLTDANECLVAGISKEVMLAAVKAAETLEPEGLKRPREYADAVVALFWPKDGDHVGYRTPYGKIGTKLLFRPGEMTLWTGASGNGKSQILSDCAVDWVHQGAKICVCSLEMKGAQTLKRMVKQMTGVDRPTDPYIRSSLEWMTQGMLIYDKVGKSGVEPILEIFSYARARHGCDMFILDSLMRIGIPSDDYVGQEKAVYRMVEWTIEADAHLHVVAHSRKGAASGGAPETEDVKGASEIGSNAFNILSIWRNKQLEDDVDDMRNAGMTDEAEALLRDKPPVLFNVAKQRNGDYEGKTGLWFDQSNYRYYSSYDKSLWSRQYVRLEKQDVA